MAGVLIAVGYFLLFQCCGLCVAFSVLKRENFVVSVIFGSVCGLVMLQWFPAVFSFFFGFSVPAHVCAAVMSVAAASVAAYFGKNRWSQLEMKGDLLRDHPIIPVLVITFVFFCFLVVHGFSRQSGAVYSSQATYGDMSMHLGFITSIAEQGMFPPEYSILPGTKLNYPFLSDSVSSSLLLLGAPLWLSYVLPMFVAGLLVLCGVYLLCYRTLHSKGKAAAAWVLFIFNGGFGFVYFLGDRESFARIFTAYYETPTNLYGENVRWVNVLVDMMLPQRATLFGWAVLFPALYLLYRAVFEKQRQNFILAGVLLGTLPMIHTHSFLFAGLLCMGWLFADQIRQLSEKRKQQAAFAGKIMFFTGVILLNTLQVPFQELEQRSGAKILLYIGLGLILFFALLAAVFLLRKCLQGGFSSLLHAWGILLIVVLVLALPQLFYWTFGNADSLLRGHFNWGNLTDNYLLFYIKNIGLSAVILPFALCLGKRRMLMRCIIPAGFVWLIAEFIQFQPNAYDNNKLLYPAFLLLCIAVADYGMDLLGKLHCKAVRALLLTGVAVLACASAVLTMGREAVASYQLFSENAVTFAQYVQENTRPQDVFLTDYRHNNEIAALTGRNVVCGSSSFLYYHGQNYSAQEAAVRQIYENPEQSMQLLQKYQVDYIVISNYERNSFEVSENAFAQLFECVYNREDIALYRIDEITGEG